MNINNIIKQGLTGEEVGKIMIKDLALMYGQILAGEKEPRNILSQAEIKALVDSIKTNKDIRDYNNYKKLFDYLKSLPLLFGINNLDAESMYWKLCNMITVLHHTETLNDDLRFNPRIMTEKQYKELHKKAFNEIMERTISVEELIFKAIQYYLELYRKGKKTKFNKYFDKAKKEPITNNRIKNNYWLEGEGGYYILPNGIKSKDLNQEEWQKELNKYPPFSEMILDLDRELTTEELLNNMRIGQENESPCKWIKENKAPDNATKFDVLEYAEGFYYSEETGTEETLKELKIDYPELYKDILNDLFSMKGLEFLKDIPEKKYFRSEEQEGIISYKILYKNKIFDYHLIDSLIKININKDNYPYREIAVIQGKSDNTDEKGYYKEKNILLKKEYMAEHILNEYKYIIPVMFDRIKEGVKESLVIKETVKLIAEYIDIPEIEVLVGEVTLINNIVHLNDIMENIPDFIFRYSGADELREKIKELLKPIKTKDLKPTPEAIKRARKFINIDIFVNNEEERIYQILRGAE